MPTKRNRYRKIDGSMAALDAWTVAMQNDPVDSNAGEADVTVYRLMG